MEELNRRRASFNILQETPEGSFSANQEFHKSPQPSNKINYSRHNSLRVAVQQRRASIISISTDNILEVAAGPNGTMNFTTSSNENLLMVRFEFSIAIQLQNGDLWGAV